MSDELPFTVSVLLEQCGGCNDIAKIILEEFVIQVADDTKEIERGFADGDLIRVGKLGHRLKGSAGVIGAKALSALCASLETAGKEGNAETAAQIYTALKAEAERCSAAIVVNQNNF